MNYKGLLPKALLICILPLTSSIGGKEDYRPACYAETSKSEYLTNYQKGEDKKESKIIFLAGNNFWGADLNYSRIGEYVNKKPPELSSEKWLNSNPLKLKDLEGKVVMLDFFATWCGPCRSSMPNLEDIWQKNKDLGFVLIGIHSAGESDSKIREFIRKYRITFPIVTEEKGKILDSYGIKAYPQYFIINKQGQVKGDYNGNTDLSKLLKEK